MNQLRLIKITVFVFTFLLIFGSLVLMGGLYRKMTAAAPQKPSDVSLGLPAGTKISQIAAGDGLLYVLVSENEKNGRIIIFNPEKNRIVSDITLN